jgi:DNA-binding response OmpR family regulator
MLVARGYEVTDARSGDEALETIRGARYDLALLEADLPGKTGFDVCVAIRSSGSKMGIIIISAHNNEQEKVLALEAGADDYILKPFSVPELLARVGALLRRKAPFSNGEPLGNLRLGDREVDFQIRRVLAQGKEVPLTYKEFEILSYLASHANKTVSGAELARTLWPCDYRDRKGSLRVIINRLRTKIEPSPKNPQYLITEPWFGYRIQLP